MTRPFTRTATLLLCLASLTRTALAGQNADPHQPGSVRFILAATVKMPVQPVRGLGFGGRGSTLAALGDDDIVRVWDASTGRLLKTIELSGHPKSVSCLAFSPDGKWIVTGEDFIKAEIFTGKIALIDVAAGREVRTLATHHWEVESLAFSQDGRWLVSSDWDRKVRALEFPSGDLRREFESPSKPRCAVITADGKVLASGGEDATVTLWERASGKELHHLTGHSGTIVSLGFSPDGRRLASASADGSVRIWDVSTGRSLRTLSGHVGAVIAVAYSCDGNYIVSGGVDSTVRIWDAATGQNLETLGANSSVWRVALSSDGRYLAAGYADGMISIWRRQP